MKTKNSPYQDLQGKTAIITGGSRGIGKAIALQLAQQGVNIILNSTTKSEKEAKQTLRDLKNLGVSVYWFPADISKNTTGKKLVDFAFAKFKNVDLLVNNAGIAASSPFVKMTNQAWRRVLNTNLNAAFFTTRAFVKKLVARNSGGTIIFISSIGTQGNPWQANYAASKSGLEALMRSVAAEHASLGIRANAISPGPVETDATVKMKPERRNMLLSQSPMGRFMTPNEIGKIALFLASSESSAINGSTIYADGGILRR